MTPLEALLAVLDGHQPESVPVYHRMRAAGQWNLGDPNSPAWAYLQSVVRAQSPERPAVGAALAKAWLGVRSDPAALYEALQLAGVTFGSGRDRPRYEELLRQSLAGLPAEFVDRFVAAAGAHIQAYWDSLPDDSITARSVVTDVAEGVRDLGSFVVQFGLAALATYGFAYGAGSLVGGGASAGASVAGAEIGAAEFGMAEFGAAESFVGPATGTVLEPGLQASGAFSYAAPGVGAPQVLGVAVGAGPFINPLTNTALPELSAPSSAAPGSSQLIDQGLTAAKAYGAQVLRQLFGPSSSAPSASSAPQQPQEGASLAPLLLIAGLALALTR